MLERACGWAKIQREEADSMTVAWPRAVAGWRKMLLKYKQDQSSPNPFEEPDAGKSVRIRIHTLKLTIHRCRVDQAEEPARQRGPGAAEGWGYLPTRYVAFRIPPVRAGG